MKSIAVGIAAIILGVACVPAGGGQSVQEDLVERAWYVCKDQVKARLMAPSTAEFTYWGSEEYAVSEMLGNQGWNIESYVDSENVYGAKVRTRWTCKAKYEGNKKWTGSVTLLD